MAPTGVLRKGIGIYNGSSRQAAGLEGRENGFLKRRLPYKNASENNRRLNNARLLFTRCMKKFRPASVIGVRSCRQPPQKTVMRGQSAMIEMIRVKLDSELPFYAEQMEAVSWERRVRIISSKLVPDKKRSLAAEMLMRICAHKWLGIPAKKVQFRRNPYGRPYVPNVRHFHFNVSHAGDYVAIVAARNTVGVDLERIRDMDQSIIKRFYTPAEREYCARACDADRQAAETQIWTLKESYIKARGKGLSLPLDSFSFRMTEPISVIPDGREVSSSLLFRFF